MSSKEFQPSHYCYICRSHNEGFPVDGSYYGKSPEKCRKCQNPIFEMPFPTAEFEELLRNPAKVAIFLQKTGDQDCRKSALALRDLLKQYKSQVTIYGGCHNAYTKKVDNSSTFDHVFFIDTPKLKDVYEWEKAAQIASNSKLWIIDHHQFSIKGGFKEVGIPYVFLCRPEFTSNCELLWKLFTSVLEPKKLPRMTATHLYEGAHLETSRLVFRGKGTLSNLAEMEPFVLWSVIRTSMLQNGLSLAIEELWIKVLQNKQLYNKNTFFFSSFSLEDYKVSFGINKHKQRPLKNSQFVHYPSKVLGATARKGGVIKYALIDIPCDWNPSEKRCLIFESLELLPKEKHDFFSKKWKFLDVANRHYRYRKGYLTKKEADKLKEEIINLFND